MKTTTAKNKSGKIIARTLKGLQSSAFALVLMTALPQAGRAAVLAGYDMDTRTTTSPATQAPAVTSEGVTASDFSLGSGLDMSAANKAFLALRFTLAPSSFANAVEANDYFTFSVTPTEGNQLSLDSLFYNLRIVETRSPTSSQWAFSLDNTTFTPIGSAFVVSATAATYPLTLTLSDIPELQNVTSTVYFRLYGWDGSTDTGGRMGIINGTGNDLVLNGSVTAVPEAGTVALLLAAALPTWYLIGRRRVTA